MALTSADLARLGPQAQKQVLDKLAGTQKPKKSKYGNRKVVRDGIKFDSEREEARFVELKVLRAMGKIRDLRLQANFTLGCKPILPSWRDTRPSRVRESSRWSTARILFTSGRPARTATERCTGCVRSRTQRARKRKTIC